VACLAERDKVPEVVVQVVVITVMYLDRRLSGAAREAAVAVDGYDAGAELLEGASA
jgi:hypothetical protein